MNAVVRYHFILRDSGVRTAANATLRGAAERPIILYSPTLVVVAVLASQVSIWLHAFVPPVTTPHDIAVSPAALQAVGPQSCTSSVADHIHELGHQTSHGRPE